MNEPRTLHVDAYVAGPLTATLQVSSLVSEEGNRWNVDGEPTIYLGSDPAVALAEFARHWDDRSEPMGIWTVTVRLDAVADLRDPSASTDVGLPSDTRTWVLDRIRCREVAAGIRATGRIGGLLVPSVPFLDDPQRWNLALFVERVADVADVANVRHPASHTLAPT